MTYRLQPLFPSLANRCLKDRKDPEAVTQGTLIPAQKQSSVQVALRPA